jgi:putative heme-binding domain-containing protein
VANRAAAGEVVSRAKLSPSQLLALTEVVQAAGPLDVDRLLSAYSQSTDDALGLKLVAALEHSAARTSLRMETLKPRLERFGPDVQKQADALYAQLRVVTADQQAKLEKLLVTLPAGDVRSGQEVFNGKKAVCSACHAIGYLGGNIGPDLTRIGQIRARRDLLESIVFPSASFVRSYEPVVITTTDGKTISGVVRADGPTELLVATGPNQCAHVPRGDVEGVQPGTVSVMPAGLADLVAFLQAAK